MFVDKRAMKSSRLVICTNFAVGFFETGSGTPSTLIDYCRHMDWFGVGPLASIHPGKICYNDF